jgi:hypothetical protein
MWQRFIDWLRPFKSPLWYWRYTNRFNWHLSCNEGNFPNLVAMPGFLYIAIWLGRPFRFHWKADWFHQLDYLATRVRELELEVIRWKGRYVTTLSEEEFLQQWPVHDD